MTRGKKIGLMFLLLGVAAYLVFAFVCLCHDTQAQTCRDIKVMVKDTAYSQFLSKAEVSQILAGKNLNPVDKPLKEVNLKRIETEISQHPLVDHAECFKTPSGKVGIDIVQKTPILRVMSSNGENYYIDTKGGVMTADSRCQAHLAVVTGNVLKTYACKYLYPLGLYLQEDPFWNAQIEQIHVLSGNKIELIPRVGNHVIYLGKIDNYPNKLARVKAFYTKALNTVGWNKYSVINVEFNNQIICTKK